MSIIMIRKFAENKKFQLVNNLCASDPFPVSVSVAEGCTAEGRMIISFMAPGIIRNVYAVIMLSLELRWQYSGEYL